jgi:hypothetical protein
MGNRKFQEESIKAGLALTALVFLPDDPYPLSIFSKIYRPHAVPQLKNLFVSSAVPALMADSGTA